MSPFYFFKFFLKTGGMFLSYLENEFWSINYFTLLIYGLLENMNAKSLAHGLAHRKRSTKGTCCQRRGMGSHSHWRHWTMGKNENVYTRSDQLRMALYFIISLLYNTVVIWPLRDIIETRLVFQNNKNSLLGQLLIFRMWIRCRKYIITTQLSLFAVIPPYVRIT